MIMRYVQRAIGIYGDASNAIFYLNFKQTLIAAHIADAFFIQVSYFGHRNTSLPSTDL